MTLLEKQIIFAKNLGLLIEFIFKQNYSCTLNEVYRDPKQALENSKLGVGIKNSLHCKKLAADLNLFDSSRKYLTTKKDWQQFGDYWKSLHPLNRWGGDFVDKFGGKIVDSNHVEMQDL